MDTNTDISGYKNKYTNIYCYKFSVLNVSYSSLETLGYPGGGDIGYNKYLSFEIPRATPSNYAKIMI